MMIPIIRDSCGNIINWFDTKEEAEAEMAYMGEDCEVSEASVEELFDHEFGGQDLNELI